MPVFRRPAAPLTPADVFAALRDRFQHSTHDPYARMNPAEPCERVRVCAWVCGWVVGWGWEGGGGGRKAAGVRSLPRWPRCRQRAVRAPPTPGPPRKRLPPAALRTAVRPPPPHTHTHTTPTTTTTTTRAPHCGAALGQRACDQAAGPGAPPARGPVGHPLCGAGVCVGVWVWVGVGGWWWGVGLGVPPPGPGGRRGPAFARGPPTPASGAVLWRPFGAAGPWAPSRHTTHHPRRRACLRCRPSSPSTAAAWAARACPAS